MASKERQPSGSGNTTFPTDCFTVNENDIIRCMTSSCEKERNKLNAIVDKIAREDLVDPMLFLLCNGYKINVISNPALKEQATAIHRAFNYKSRKILAIKSLFFSCDQDINFTDKDGLSILHIACAVGNIEAVKHFLSGGADMNGFCSKDFHFKNYTPLHFAVRHGHKDIVKLLLDAGADVGAKKGDGPTPLHCACWSDKPWYGWPKTKTRYEETFENVGLLIMKILLDKGISLSKDDKYKNIVSSVFSESLFENFLEMEKKDFVFSRCREVVDRDREYRKGKLQLLLNYGARANVSLANIIQNLELSRWTLKYDYIHLDDRIIAEMIEMIIERGANVESKNSKNESSLHLAVSYMSADIVGILLKHGAKVDTVKFEHTKENYNFKFFVIFPTLEAVENVLLIIVMLKEHGFVFNLVEHLAILRFLIHNDNFYWLANEDNAGYTILNMLDYGTSAAIERNLKKMLKIELYRGLMDLVNEYLTIMREGEFFLDENVKKTLSKFKGWVFGDLDTEKEYDLMKKVMLSDNVSFYTAMQMHPYKLWPYLQNCQYRSYTRSLDFDKKLPLLCNTIRGHFAKCLIRCYIISLAKDYLKVIVPVELPDRCYQKILEVLSNEEIWNLCFAACPTAEPLSKIGDDDENESDDDSVDDIIKSCLRNDILSAYNIKL